VITQVWRLVGVINMETTEITELYDKVNKEYKQKKLLKLNKILWLYNAGAIGMLCAAVGMLAAKNDNTLLLGIFIGLGTITPAMMVAGWRGVWQ